MIQIEGIAGGYAKKTILQGIHLEVEKGEFFALLGPNGSGKTTLFKLITGQLPILEGTIEIDGIPLKKLSKLEKAKKIAVLAQEVTATFDYTVEEIVALGRYPHQQGLLKTLTAHDRQKMEEAMDATDVLPFRAKRFRSLSGGEKQRVLLAKALAQEPEILLLDEPTNHLDIHHTFQLLDQLKEWQRTKGLTVFAILHDLNVASLYADRVALLHNGSFLEVGDVYTLRKEHQLKKVYNVEVKTQPHPIVPNPQLLLTPQHTRDSDALPLAELLTVETGEDQLRIRSSEPLRTLSNALIGEGIQWLTEYFAVRGPLTDDCSANKEWLAGKMKEQNIPLEKAAGFLTGGRLSQVVNTTNQQNFEMFVWTLADWTDDGQLNNLLILLVMDNHVSDQLLINSYRCAIEAKMEAIHHASVPVFDQSNDWLAVACRQKKTDHQQVHNEFELLQQIKQTVYNSVQTTIAAERVV